jgi:hypothetical protein
MEEWMDGWDGWMDGQTNRGISPCLSLFDFALRAQYLYLLIPIPLHTIVVIVFFRYCCCFSCRF